LALTGGTRGQWEEEGKRVPVRGVGRVGCGLLSLLGRNGVPWPFFYFYFVFFFSFLIFRFVSKSFAKRLQFNSNHFQKFSKNPCNDLTLQEI
jgi:hypothetical protein